MTAKRFDKLTAREFYSALLGSLEKRKDIVIKRYKIRYKRSQCDFLRIASKKIRQEDKIILIRAGIHGDEIAGPLTILNYVNEIINKIHDNNLKIILYPLGNPSGFEAGTRYNEDDNGRKIPNNDFLWYELEDGEITDDIGKSDEFKKWYWSSDRKLKIKLPAETKLMHELLKNDPLSRIAAVLDLHQDCISDFPAAAYHYAFGNLSRYQGIVEKIEEIAPVARNTDVEAGESSPQKSDGQGFIVRHDGTLPDLMFRLEVRHCVTVETTVATPTIVAWQVNLIWIYGIADLLKPAFSR